MSTPPSFPTPPTTAVPTFAAPPPSLLVRPPTVRERLADLLHRIAPTRADLVDGAFAAVLTAIAVYGLATTFDGLLWLVPAVVGILLGLALTHVLQAVGLPGAGILVVLAAVYFLLGGAVATREALIVGFVPSGTTLVSLAHASVFGWKELLTSLPPVDSRGPLMALPFLFGMLGAATSYGVGRGLSRWTRPAPVVLVVPVALLALGILLGTTTPALLVLQGTLFGLVLIGWAAVRASRRRATLQNGAGRAVRATTTAVLLGLAVVGGQLLGPLLPGHDDTARTVWRTGLEPPFDVSQYPSPLAGFRRYTEPNPAKLYSTTLWTVSGLPAGVPMRIATLDSYDGSVWGAGDVANDGLSTDTGDTGGTSGSGDAADGTSSGTGDGTTFQRVGSHIAVSAPGTPVTVTVTVPAKGYSGVWMPTLGTVTGIRFQGSGADSLADDLRFNVDTNTAVLPGGLNPGDSYRLEAIVPPAAASAPPAELDTANGSLVDTQSLGFTDAKVDSWSANLTDPYAKLLAVAKTMESTGAYTDGGVPGSYQNIYLPGHSLSRMARFFGSTQLAGDDEQYAAALALVGNRLNIPTRVVLGAIPESGGAVLGKDVHAWVEVRTDDGTWQAILPSSFVPDRNKQPKQQQNRSQEQKQGAQVPPPSTNNPPSILQGPDQAQNATNLRPPQKPNVFNPQNWPRWLQLLALYVVLPLLVLLLLYVVLRLTKRRRARRRRRTGSPATRIAGGWAEVVDTARDLGMPLGRRLTRLEQSSALERQLLSGSTGSKGSSPSSPSSPSSQETPAAEPGEPGERGERGERGEPPAGFVPLRPLAQEANSLVFAAADPTDEQVDDYWTQVAAATAYLRARASFWARLRADLSLGGYRPDRRRERTGVTAGRGSGGWPRLPRPRSRGRDRSGASEAPA